MGVKTRGYHLCLYKKNPKNVQTCQKLSRKYISPFKVTGCINPMTVELQLCKALRHVLPVFLFSLLENAPGTCVWAQRNQAVPHAILVGGEGYHEGG